MIIEKVNVGYGPYLKVSTDDGEHIGDVMQKINGNRAGSWGFELAGERGGASFRRHYTSARLAFEAMIKRANTASTGQVTPVPSNQVIQADNLVPSK